MEGDVALSNFQGGTRTSICSSPKANTRAFMARGALDIGSACKVFCRRRVRRSCASFRLANKQAPRLTTQNGSGPSEGLAAQNTSENIFSESLFIQLDSMLLYIFLARFVVNISLSLLPFAEALQHHLVPSGHPREHCAPPLSCHA